LLNLIYGRRRLARADPFCGHGPGQLTGCWKGFPSSRLTFSGAATSSSNLQPSGLTATERASSDGFEEPVEHIIVVRGARLASDWEYARRRDGYATAGLDA
jgi:hypothetical protein